ncbi:ArdC-like ssDNA-binding domain-containing protein [Bernardetia sp. ABR2-2B]|uniref:ArdC-like ssDNA-binding domain-containing protein n=1 Tax=Bernardetia sp. ABR2-2B TaxID=3127472 RepID=UPI0030D09D9E
MTNIQEITELANIHAAEYGTSRKEKYIYLSNLSRSLLEAIEDDNLTAEFYEDCENTNAILKKYYQNQYRVKEFNTFKGWQKEGFKVRKGAKAFLLWSKPKGKKVDEEKKVEINKNVFVEGAISEETEEKKKYYIAYLFSNLQVEKIEL